MDENAVAAVTPTTSVLHAANMAVVEELLDRATALDGVVTLTGTDAADTLTGGWGNDTLNGGNGFFQGRFYIESV